MSKNKIYADIQMVETEKLRPNDYNPNIMTDEQFQSIVQDFEENGFVGQPIIVDKNNEIIDGEHRWRVARHLDLEKVPVIYFNPKDEDHKKMLTIGWNKKKGEMSPTKLAEIVTDLNQRYTLEELSGKLGFNANQLKDNLAMSQVTKEFIDKIKKDAEEQGKEIPAVLNFAVSKEQEKLINEALEISEGNSKGEKLYHICSAYIKNNLKNG